MKKWFMSSILIPVSLLSSSAMGVASPVDEVILVRDYINIKKLDIRGCIDDILLLLKRVFDFKLDGNLTDAFILEKHGNLNIALWFYKSGEYFVHIYDETSSHKGSNLYQISNDIMMDSDPWKDKVVREYFPERFFFSMGDEISDSNNMDFRYSINQPDLSLLKLLIGFEKAHLLVDRGWPTYGDTYEECEESFFRDYPGLKKYSFPIKDNFKMHNFKLKTN